MAKALRNSSSRSYSCKQKLVSTVHVSSWMICCLAQSTCPKQLACCLFSIPTEFRDYKLG